MQNAGGVTAILSSTPFSLSSTQKWSATLSPIPSKSKKQKGVAVPGKFSRTETNNGRVFFLDVNPICYKGNRPSLDSFAHWISLFFSQVSLSHPVIAVVDGEGGHQHRKQILPSYKAHRIKFFRRVSTPRELPHFPDGGSHQIITEFLKGCNVPNGANLTTSHLPALLFPHTYILVFDPGGSRSSVQYQASTTSLQGCRHSECGRSKEVWVFDPGIPKDKGFLGLLEDEILTVFDLAPLTMVICCILGFIDLIGTSFYSSIILVYDPGGMYEVGSRSERHMSMIGNMRQVQAVLVLAPTIFQIVILEDKDHFKGSVLKMAGEEADDVIATLAKQVLDRGRKVVIASPDKDFKQLISEDVQLVQPLPDLNRWSFYTLKHYIAQYNCDPQCDLSLRCIIGDEVDGVPGIQNLVSGFGRKTALKLLRKHGSLENLLDAASVRTVGKPYAQEALTKYAPELRRNYQVLALRRDIDVHVQAEWLSERDSTNDSTAIEKLRKSVRGC